MMNMAVQSQSDLQTTFLVLSLKSGPATETGSLVFSDKTAKEHVASKPIPFIFSGVMLVFSSAVLTQ